jgi:hypothetical protein
MTHWWKITPAILALAIAVALVLSTGAHAGG